MGRPVIGNLELGTYPRIVAIIDILRPIEGIKNIKEMGADIFEIRVDCFTIEFDKILAYVRTIRETLEVPIIGTIRETPYTKSHRLSMFNSLLPYLDAIDIELDTSLAQAVIDQAKNKTIIVSEHNYECTPTDQEMTRMVLDAKSQGADIVKLAVTATNQHDLIRFLAFTENCQENIVAIAMGEIGKLSRVVAPLYGSLFTYAYIGEQVAPGQLSLKEMVEEIARYYPKS